jgi:cellulose synthase operon protein C
MKRPLRCIVATAFLVTLGSAVGAQSITDRDLKALVFYLQQGDQQSADAELRRLRAAFPDWVPPADLGSLQTGVPASETDVIWRRIEKGDLAGARAEIARVQADYPTWTVPDDMSRLIATASAQAEFDAAFARGDLAAAQDAARATPGILVCDRVNNAWSLATLQIAAGLTDAALATYKGVLAACSEGSSIVSTLEKANDITTEEQLGALFQVASSSHPGNEATLAALQARLLAGRGGAGAVVASATPQAQAAPAPAPAAGAPLRVLVTPPEPPAVTPKPRPATGGGEGAASSGGASSGASAGSGSSGRSNGSGLPSRGDGRLRSVQAAASSANWAECLARSSNPGSVDVLYERSWCAFNLNRQREALAGFQAAANAGLGGTVARDARFGMMLSYLSMTMTEEASRLAATTDLTRDQRVQIESAILDQRAVRSYKQGKWANTVAYLDALEQVGGGIRRDLAMLRGYALMKLGKNAKALEEFRALDNALSTRETRAALRSLRG